MILQAPSSHKFSEQLDFFWPQTLSTVFPPILPWITLVENRFVCAYTISLHPSILPCYYCYSSLPGCGGLFACTPDPTQTRSQSSRSPATRKQASLPTSFIAFVPPRALTFKLVLTLKDFLCSLFQAQLLILKRDPDI